MNLNHFLHISLITPLTLDWLWQSGLVMCRSIPCFWTSFKKNAPFEVVYLDPSQTRRSITQKSLMNYLSPCPAALFFLHGVCSSEEVIVGEYLCIAVAGKGLIPPIQCIYKYRPLDAWSLKYAVGSVSYWDRHDGWSEHRLSCCLQCLGGVA